jgi:predicted chitinase
VYHECRFRSIKEIKAKEGTAVWEMQKKYWHTGYYGRGFSQLTWQRNYAKFSPIVGRDLVASPDDALIPDVGAKIIVHGMVTGMFTGKALKGYFTDTKTDWLNARRIVNGTFMADKVADAAKKIHPLLV